MEDKFNQGDFEEFLQGQVRNQRMYPSDAVWRDINNKLHGEKRWPALTIAAFIILGATVGICVKFTPKSNIFSIQPALEPINSSKAVAQKDNVLNKITSSTPFNKHNNLSEDIVAPKIQSKNNNASDFDERDQPFEEVAVAEQNLNKDRIRERAIVVQMPVNRILRSEEGSQSILSKSGNETTSKLLQVAIPVIPLQPQEDDKAVQDIETELASKEAPQKEAVEQSNQENKKEVALQLVTKPKTVKHKFGFQVYIAPSISYRKLFEDPFIQKGNNGGPVGLNYVTDVNNVVRHKPGTGIEAGFSLLYNLTNSFKVKTGFQFNVRQYSINAYRSGTELASIALISSNSVDTVNTIAVYRNSNGYSNTDLINRYYQLSIPIGVEWEVVGNRRIQFNVAASIQPTYLLNRDAYLLTTNFKNYTENPDMVRKWNLNSNIEAFVSYQVGDFKWQLGPQMRYQPYSTFITTYPIKEHLLDYGIKLGFSKTFR